MAYEVFYRSGKLVDSFIVEGETIEEIKEKTKVELDKRNAKYRYADWLNN